MEQVHIIHVSTAKSWRGGEQQLAYLIMALAEQEVNQEVLCLKNAPFSAFCAKNKIAFTTFRKFGALNLLAAWILKKHCQHKRPVLVHCHDSHAHTIAYLSARVFMNSSPLIIHRRVDFPVKHSSFSIAKYNHASIARFICVSNAIKEILTPSLNVPEKAIVIHSGIDLSRFSNVIKTNILRKEFNLSEKNILIGNVSALAPHKDYLTFIKTAEILSHRNSDFRFIIIGEGNERSYIENEIKTRELTDRVFMTGFRTNIPDLLKELNVLLLTSKTEGLGTTILDAFAGGLPVVATKAGGIPEIVEHKVTGLLADIGNAQQLALMTELIVKNKELRKNIVINAGNKVKNFDFRITASKTLKVYHQVVSLKTITN